MTELQTKICRKCSSEKAASDFYAHKATLDGFASYCKTCVKKVSDEWRANNKERTAELNRKKVSEHRTRNRDSLNAKQKVLRDANPQKNRDAVKRWTIENPEKAKARQLKTVEEMPRYYLAVQIGISTKDCPTELIELKRDQLTIKRLSRQIKQTTKAHNETSTNIS